jgi:hypothetical protein
MLKFAKYFVLLIALFYWSISHFESLYSWAGKSKIFPDDYRYGDLYRLSFLPQFKGKENACEDKFAKNSIKNNVHLYLLGDSFADESNLNANNFAVEKYKYIHWDKPETVDFDTSAKNILILESVERSAKMHFVKKSDEIQFSNSNKIKPQIANFSIINELENWVEVFSHNTKKTEERLWHTLLNYDFVLFFKEIKANFDLNIFDRKSSNYNLSADKSEIFYFEEADVNCPNSAFYKVSDAEIDGFVKIINENYIHYKSMGFDEVYLSIIPNKVSILSPNMGDYNHVLERIQNHPNLKVKFIDTYSIFKKQPKNIFAKSDTHWNCVGSSIWQGVVNELVAK